MVNTEKYRPNTDRKYRIGIQLYSLGALEQVWLNEGRVAMIIPLKQLEKFCPVVYNSTHNGGAFVCRTKDGDVVLNAQEQRQGHALP